MEGNLHRFSKPSNGEVHWNGSTAGVDPIKPQNIPNEIKKFSGTEGRIMLIGTPSVFAIESSITQAYSNPSLRALGYFTIYVAGKNYGVRSPNASMLACSFDAVQRRLDRRGLHSLPNLEKASAISIVDAVHSAIYGEIATGGSLFDMPVQNFTQNLIESEILWAPDGDEAFDDGGHVLQFDEENIVRLIAFINSDDPGSFAEDLNEVLLSSDDFYGTLRSWKIAFEEEWREKIKNFQK